MLICTLKRFDILLLFIHFMNLYGLKLFSLGFPFGCQKDSKNKKTTSDRRSLFHSSTLGTHRVLWEPTCFCIRFNYLII